MRSRPEGVQTEECQAAAAAALSTTAGPDGPLQRRRVFEPGMARACHPALTLFEGPPALVCFFSAQPTPRSCLASCKSCRSPGLLPAHARTSSMP